MATQFGDLHDAPVRMKSVGCIRQVVPWSNSRKFFYWRRKRQLAGFSLCRQVVAASADGSRRCGLGAVLKGAVNGGRVLRHQNVSVGCDHTATRTCGCGC
jgi:hypothetical protein